MLRPKSRKSITRYLIMLLALLVTAFSFTPINVIADGSGGDPPPNPPIPPIDTIGAGSSIPGDDIIQLQVDSDNNIAEVSILDLLWIFAQVVI